MLPLLMHDSGDERWAKRDGGARTLVSMAWPDDEHVGKIGSSTSGVVAELPVPVVRARVLRRRLWSLKKRPRGGGESAGGGLVVGDAGGFSAPGFGVVVGDGDG